MQKTLTDLLIERKKERNKYVKNWLKYAKKIKKIAQENLAKDVKVYVFGSVIKGSFGPKSDIDIMIVSEKFKDPQKRSKFGGELLRKGFCQPFEFHFITPEVFKNWYKKFIKNNILEI